MILSSSALELVKENINIIMNNLIVDAASDKIFLTHIIDKIIYTCAHENSKTNFEKLIVLIDEFLLKNDNLLNQIKVIYVNRGPGSFAGIRNSLSIVKALHLTKKIDYYCFSFSDFNELDDLNHQNIPNLCKKYNMKKNLINPIYLS